KQVSDGMPRDACAAPATVSGSKAHRYATGCKSGKAMRRTMNVRPAHEPGYRPATHRRSSAGWRRDLSDLVSPSLDFGFVLVLPCGDAWRAVREFSMQFKLKLAALAVASVFPFSVSAEERSTILDPLLVTATAGDMTDVDPRSASSSKSRT